MKFQYSILSIFTLVALSFLFVSCGKESLNSRLSKQLDQNDITTVDLLQTVLNSTDRFMATDAYYGRYAILIGELRSDNCVANGASSPFPLYEEYNFGEINAELSDPEILWENAYRAIAAANLVISLENKKLDGDPDRQKRIIVGQAYALRALIHYDLLRFFGAQHVTDSETGIPYITTYPAADFSPARIPIDAIKTQLNKDLALALLMLKEDPEPSKIYMSSYAALVLRAHIALWFEEWEKALESTTIVTESGQFQIVDKDKCIASWHKKLNENSIFELSITTEATQNQMLLASVY